MLTKMKIKNTIVIIFEMKMCFGITEEQRVEDIISSDRGKVFKIGRKF